MFCPKCGVDSLEAQRFCKACGTNLQLINDALRTGDAPAGPFGLDVDTLARNAREFAQSFKSGWSGAAAKINSGEWPPRGNTIEKHRISHEIRKQAREEARRQNLPKPREYMSYSWQHNLKNGLISLFWGAGLGIFLYYMSQNAINNGVIERIEEASRGRVQGIEPLVRIFWMIALLPMLKGLAQIIYAAFFGESMATLTERFTPRASLEEAKPFLRHDTAPVNEREPAQPTYETPPEPPSVTEHTTHFFDEGKVRESQ